MSLGLTRQEKSAVSFMPLRRSEPVLGSKAETYGPNSEMDEENPSLMLGILAVKVTSVTPCPGSSCKKDPGLWVITLFSFSTPGS